MKIVDISLQVGVTSPFRLPSGSLQAPELGRRVKSMLTC